MSKSKILLIVTGSVGAFKAAALASKLTQSGCVVRTVLTESARQFVGSAQFEGLTREKVYSSAFESGEAHSHLTLSQWADLTLVYPATANLLGKWSSGIGDDLASLIFLGHEDRSRIWVFPAMNPRMWAHPAVAESIARLTQWGVTIQRPDQGRMACGDVGEGRLPEPEAVANAVQEFLKLSSRSNSGPAILVTAGGTREPVDAVRSLTNTSTGETGVRVAEALAQAGFRVTLLQSRASRAATGRMESVSFDTFKDFHEQYRRLLEKGAFKGLVHAAAVSDFHVVGGGFGKIDSKDSGLALQLQPNPKLLSLAREYSQGSLRRIVSFKLTAGTDDFDVNKYGVSDWIIQNRVEDVIDERHAARVLAKSGSGFAEAARLTTKTELADWIVKRMTKELREV